MASRSLLGYVESIYAAIGTTYVRSETQHLRVRAFISYAHDSEEHVKRVLSLAERLRQDGVDAWLDQYENAQPDDGWPRWMERQMDRAHYVLLICSPAYHKRFRGHEEPGKGLGASWEGVLIQSALYGTQGSSRKFLPVLFQDASDDDVPMPLRHHRTHFRLMSDYEKLLRFLTDQPSIVPSEVRDPPHLEPRPTPELPDEHAESEPRLFATSIRKHMAELNRHIEALTREQYRIIRLLGQVRRVRIAGCAGSGKTLVAAEKAVRLAAAGLKTLFLCHSPLLAGHVAGLTRGTPVVVWAFCDWVRWLSKTPSDTLGATWTNYDEPDTATLEAAFDVLTEAGGSFDAVIVDEGQDFRPEWWVVVEAALAGQRVGILYIFHDDHQALLPHRTAYPIDEPVLDLSRNCRNAGRIFELVRYFHTQAPEPELPLHEAGQLFVVQVSLGNEIAGLREALLRIQAAGLAEGEVVLLLGGGLRTADWAASGTEVEVPTIGPWQEDVRRYFERAILRYDRRGVVPPEGGIDEVRARLARLSDEAAPTTADIELVRQLAGSFSIAGNIRRHILDRRGHGNALRWRFDGERLRLLRRNPSPLWSAEIVLHFEGEDWMAGLPPPRRVRLEPEKRGSHGNSLGVFDLSAFKGLEADTVILMASGYRPMRQEEVYVAVSRARFALAVVDCGAGLLLPEEIVGPRG